MKNMCRLPFRTKSTHLSTWYVFGGGGFGVIFSIERGSSSVSDVKTNESLYETSLFIYILMK